VEPVQLHDRHVTTMQTVKTAIPEMRSHGVRRTDIANANRDTKSAAANFAIIMNPRAPKSSIGRPTARDASNRSQRATALAMKKMGVFAEGC
jgi:hypothetical protein